MVLTCSQDIHHSSLSELACNRYTPHTFVAFLAFDHLFHLADPDVQLAVSMLA